MKIEKLSNGQIEVTNGNLHLIYTDCDDGEKYNDCVIHHQDYCETVSSQDPRFDNLFIALINWKNGY